MGMGRLATRGISWLEEALQELAKKQPKQQPSQILAQLQKNPRVSMEEVRDRGFDTFLEAREARGNAPLDLTAQGMGTPKGYLQRSPVPRAYVDPQMEFQDYATRGLQDYRENVRFNPDWDERAGSSHFPMPGYQYHTREGTLPDTNLGNIRVLDELQQDLTGRGKTVTKQFRDRGGVIDDTQGAREQQEHMWGNLSRNWDVEDAWRYEPEAGPEGYQRAQREIDYRMGDTDNEVLQQDLADLLDANQRLYDAEYTPYNMPLSLIHI